MERLVDIKKIASISAIVIAIGIPTFAAKKDEQLIEMPKTYPAKYTAEYVKQITPLFMLHWIC